MICAIGHTKKNDILLQDVHLMKHSPTAIYQTKAKLPTQNV